MLLTKFFMITGDFSYICLVLLPSYCMLCLKFFIGIAYV